MDHMGTEYVIFVIVDLDVGESDPRRYFNGSLTYLAPCPPSFTPNDLIADHFGHSLDFASFQLSFVDMFFRYISQPGADTDMSQPGG